MIIIRLLGLAMLIAVFMWLGMPFAKVVIGLFLLLFGAAMLFGSD